MSFQFLSRGLSRNILTGSLSQFMGARSWSPQSSLVIRSFASKKHKNLLKHAKGFRGRAKNCFTIAIRRVHKSWQYAYRDRKQKKRNWHSLWIQRIQAGVRQYSFRYSDFYGAYRKSGMQMDRKILSELAEKEPFAFRSVVQVVEHQKMTANAVK